MKTIYAEHDDNGNIPLVARDCGTPRLTVEVSAFRGCLTVGSIYTVLTLEQAEKLRDRLIAWCNGWREKQ